MKELATDTDTSVRKVHLAKQKAIRRIKKFIGVLNENEEKYGKKEADGKYVSPSRSKLQIAIQLEPIRKDETRERDYSKAMSFVNTPPEV
jgi:hypothetical protein